MHERELTIAFGPLGAIGLVLLAVGLVRRSRVLGSVGAAALWADATRPELGGFAARNRR